MGYPTLISWFDNSKVVYPDIPQASTDSMITPFVDLFTGKLIDDGGGGKEAPGQKKRKFSSFFKNLVIELDKDLYGPENHLVEWHRTPTTQETDGFQVKRVMNKSKAETKCSIFFMLGMIYRLSCLPSPMTFREIYGTISWTFTNQKSIGEPDIDECKITNKTQSYP